jgi:hypothetical protein
MVHRHIEKSHYLRRKVILRTIFGLATCLLAGTFVYVLVAPRVRIHIVNQTESSVHSVKLYSGDAIFTLGELQAGQQKSIGLRNKGESGLEIEFKVGDGTPIKNK